MIGAGAGSVPSRIAAGSRLGPYEIRTLLGTGGMGEVYRARDMRLSRDVALKVISGTAAADAERFRRFQREAESMAALSHPNVVSIYDIGEAGGVPYIVSELVSGGTLRNVLDRGPLPARKLLDLAVPIARGLAAAHERGMAHRDLKPENILLAADGTPKIADFGLAKHFLPASDPESSELTTLADERTREGLVLGTVGYMSPEQAKGEAVDFRGDQFSFGAILYEMATGKRAFRKPTAAQSLAAIIDAEPDPLASLNPTIPAPLRWTIERCLAKEPERRYAATEDLARDLETLRERLPETEVALPEGMLFAGKARWRVPAAIAGALLVALLPAALFLFPRPIRPPAFRMLALRRGLVAAARFTPDGHTIVYGAGWDGRPIEIFFTRLPDPGSQPLGLPPASVLSISSRGELAISRDCQFRLMGEHACFGTLARVPLAGGKPRDLMERAHEADWSPDGKELAAVREEVGGGHRLEFPVGKVLYSSAGWIGHPRVSPKGDLVAIFDKMPGSRGSGAIAVVDRSGKKKVLSSGWDHCWGLAWHPKGDEVWFTPVRPDDDGSLYAVGLSGRQRTVWRWAGPHRLHDISADGRALMTRESPRAALVAFTRGEETERDLSWFGFSIATDISEDGKLLLFNESGNVGGMFIRGTDGSPAVSLGEGEALSLSPDGKWVLSRERSTASSRFFLVPTGAGEPRPVVPAGLEEFWNGRFFDAGRQIVIEGNEKKRPPRCFGFELATGRLRTLTPEGTEECLVSPDGRWVAAVAQGEKFNLFPIEREAEAPRLLSAMGPGERPLRWGADGDSLFVRTRGVPARIVRLDVVTGRRENWRDIVPSDPAGLLGIEEVTVTPDGRHYAYTYRSLLSELYLVDGLK